MSGKCLGSVWEVSGKCLGRVAVEPLEVAAGRSPPLQLVPPVDETEVGPLLGRRDFGGLEGGGVRARAEDEPKRATHEPPLRSLLFCRVCARAPRVRRKSGRRAYDECSTPRLRVTEAWYSPSCTLISYQLRRRTRHAG